MKNLTFERFCPQRQSKERNEDCHIKTEDLWDKAKEGGEREKLTADNFLVFILVCLALASVPSFLLPWRRQREGLLGPEALINASLWRFHSVASIDILNSLLAR